MVSTLPENGGGRKGLQEKGDWRVTAGSELPLGLAESLTMQLLGLRDKTWQLLWKSGKQLWVVAQLRLPAACRGNQEHLLQASWEQRGDQRGQRRCCPPCQQLPDQSVPGWLSLGQSSSPRKGRRGRGLGPSWASFNRFGEHCLVRYLLSCSMANPGWREESLTITDSWVPAAA